MGYEITDEYSKKIDIVASFLGITSAEVIDEALKRELEPYLGMNLDISPKKGIFIDKCPYTIQVAKNEGRTFIPAEEPCFILEEKKIFGESKVRIVVNGRLLTVSKSYVRYVNG